MTPARKKRIFLIVLMVAGVSIATGFALKAFNENLMFFFSVTDTVKGKAPATKDFRLGGMVVNGSVKRDAGSLAVSFQLTDNAEVISVYYDGILPDLFREGQGIISKGKLRSDGVFVADEVLAKHDENYMPPEVADSMKVKK
ncbi:MAG: cytochrome c maturation protein CcmE [Gammaproteobacteria bacterium]|nr:cytochrome c maturation protein CcmE [Gammaproteobacteria bacterium]